MYSDPLDDDNEFDKSFLIHILQRHQLRLLANKYVPEKELAATRRILYQVDKVNIARAIAEEDDRELVRGGARRKPKPPKASCWHATRRTVMCRDGKKRTVHTNPAKQGEQRVRKMVTRRGKTVATYVLP
jgi:hypothetical protein